jgi:hypothetical protein
MWASKKVMHSFPPASALRVAAPDDGQYKVMSPDEAIQDLYNRVDGLQARVRELEETDREVLRTLKAQQGNIIALDKKIEQHKQDRGAHCDWDRGERGHELVRPYSVEA